MKVIQKKNAGEGGGRVISIDIGKIAKLSVCNFLKGEEVGFFKVKMVKKDWETMLP